MLDVDSSRRAAIGKLVALGLGTELVVGCGEQQTGALKKDGVSTDAEVTINTGNGDSHRYFVNNTDFQYDNYSASLGYRFSKRGSDRYAYKFNPQGGLPRGPLQVEFQHGVTERFTQHPEGVRNTFTRAEPAPLPDLSRVIGDNSHQRWLVGELSLFEMNASGEISTRRWLIENDQANSPAIVIEGVKIRVNRAWERSKQGNDLKPAVPNMGVQLYVMDGIGKGLAAYLFERHMNLP